MTEAEPLLLEVEHILDAHSVSIEMYGGAAGILDPGGIESIIGSVRNALSYQSMSIFEIAAKYGYKIIKNHCFEDGNKRVGAYVSCVYLLSQGFVFDYTQQEAIDIFLGVATSNVSEAELAAWLKSKAAVLSQA